MRIERSPTITQPVYRGYSINADLSMPCFKILLDRLIDQFESMTSNYPSVMFVFTTLKFPQQIDYEFSNPYIKRTMNSLVHYLEGNGLPCAYTWVPECSGDGGIHFHLVLTVATNWEKAFDIIVGKIKEYWASSLGIADAGGLVDYSSADNGIIMRQGTQDFTQALNACVYHASYVAKTNTKGSLPPHCKGFGASQLRSSVLVL